MTVGWSTMPVMRFVIRTVHAALLCLALAACGGGEPVASPGPTAAGTQTVEQPARGATDEATEAVTEAAEEEPSEAATEEPFAWPATGRPDAPDGTFRYDDNAGGRSAAANADDLHTTHLPAIAADLQALGAAPTDGPVMLGPDLMVEPGGYTSEIGVIIGRDPRYQGIGAVIPYIDAGGTVQLRIHGWAVDIADPAVPGSDMTVVATFPPCSTPLDGWPVATPDDLGYALLVIMDRFVIDAVDFTEGADAVPAAEVADQLGVPAGYPGCTG